MMFTFKYSVDNVKECIIETERQLRDLISTVLTAKYGPGWESTQYGWSDRKREELERRRYDEQRKFPHQRLSDRLIDYSDILHLKSLIEKNWQHFSRVFGSKENTMVMFDILQKLRNPVMHGRTGILLHQLYLCLGICGELLLAVEKWRRGYMHTVYAYACDLRFPVYVEGGNEEAAQNQAKKLARCWLEKVVSRLGDKLEEKFSDEFSKEWLLRLSKGHVRIKMVWNYRGYDGRYFRAVDIRLQTRSLDALDHVLTKGKHPYWVLRWILSDDLDVSIVASRVKEMTGRTPSSSASVQIGSGIPVLTSADYRIGAFYGARIRVTLSRGQPDSRAVVCIVYDGQSNKGFFQAHKVFTVDLILSILYGELTPNKVHQLIKNACTPLTWV